MANKKGKPYGTAFEKYARYASKERQAFSSRLQQLMKEQNLSYEALSERLGGRISTSTLQSYVSMNSEPGSLEKIILLARELNCSLDYLVGVADRPLEPEAKGMPEYLGVSAKTVDSLHRARTEAPIRTRRDTGVPRVTGGEALGILLENHSAELLGALGGLMDTLYLTKDFTLSLRDTPPGKLSVLENQKLLANLEIMQRELGYQENRVMTVIQEAMAETGLKDVEAGLDQIHAAVVDALDACEARMVDGASSMMEANPLEIEFTVDGAAEVKPPEQ